MAFQIAGAMVFKESISSQAGPQILEPVLRSEILCQDTAMGDIMGDLQTRRAIIMGMDSEGIIKDQSESAFGWNAQLFFNFQGLSLVKVKI